MCKRPCALLGRRSPAYLAMARTWKEMKDAPELSFMCFICSSVSSPRVEESFRGWSSFRKQRVVRKGNIGGKGALGEQEG